MAAQYLLISILNAIVFFLLYKQKSIDDIYNKANQSLHNKSYLLFLVLSVVSIFFATNITESIIVLFQFTNLYVAYILILVLGNNKRIDFIKIFIYFTVIGLLIETLRINSLVYDSVITRGNFLERSMEFRGFTGNINISSFALALKLPVLIYLIFKIKNYYKLILFYILLTSTVLSIILLFSRAALIVLSLIVLFAFMYALFKRNKNLILKAVFIILSCLLGMGSYSLINEKNATDIMVDRFSTVTNPVDDQSVNERIGFYKIAIEDIKANPLFGVGIGNWKLISIQRANKFLDGYRIPYRVHNDFLEIAAEVGLIGGLSFLYFIFYPFFISFIKLIKNKDLTISFLIVLIVGVYIFDSMLNFPMHRPITFMYLIFTFVLFYNARSKKLL